MARSDYVQHVVRPGSWSPAGFVTAVVVILIDMYFVAQQGAGRENVGFRFYRDRDIDRAMLATVYLVAGISSAFLVMNYQDQYFTDVGKLGLRPLRDMPQSIYPWFYEEYLDRMPQMFQMMHLRSWAGEAATPKPEWGCFIWFSHQYLSGLISFSCFLLTQSHIRRLKWFTMLAFIWVAMTSLSCAHCLMFMFIILTPTTNDHHWFDIEVLHAAVGLLSLAHHVATGMLMITINSPSFQRQLLITTIIPLLFPLLVWIVPKVDNHHRRLISIWEAQSKVFLTTGLLSVLLYWVTNWFIFGGTAVVNPEDLGYSVFLKRSDVLDGFRLGLRKFLEQDASVLAVSCDVMLTLLVLLTWTPVSSVSLWGLLKCSVNPWLETGQRTVWDNALNLGAALARANQPRPVQPREPPWWRLAITVCLWMFGGIGCAVSAVLGAGVRRLDP